MRREEPARVAVPVSRDDKRALPASRWTQHRGQDGRAAWMLPARPSEGAKENVERALRAAVLRALLDGFLLGLSRFRGSRPTDEAPIRRKRPALFAKGDPQNTRLAALGTGVHGLFLRAGPFALSLRPSSSHVRGAVCDSAPGCRARLRGGIRLVRPARAGQRTRREGPPAGAPTLLADCRRTCRGLFLRAARCHLKVLRAFGLRDGGARILEPVHDLAVTAVLAARGDGVPVGRRPTRPVLGDSLSASANGDGAIWRGHVLVILCALAPAILAASPGEPGGSRIADVNAIVQAFVKLPGCLSGRESRRQPKSDAEQGGNSPTMAPGRALIERPNACCDRPPLFPAGLARLEMERL